MDDKDKLIEEIQDQCEYFAKDIIIRLCKRAIRKMNSWNVQIISDDYPAQFKFFDALSIECQSKYYNEISPYLQETIEGVLDDEYENLPPKERFFVDYSQCYCDNGYDQISIQQLIYNRFNDMLNEHWQSKKISKFEESR